MYSVLLLLLFICFFFFAFMRFDHYDDFRETKDEKGRRGEDTVSRKLLNLGEHGRMLMNCYLPTSKNRTTEIDLLYLDETGIYVIESKNYSGWIFGHENQEMWTQTLSSRYGSKKLKFYNPMKQNDTHIQWLAKYLDLPESNFYSYIVFSDRCLFKDVPYYHEKHKILHSNEFHRAMVQSIQTKNKRFTPEQIQTLYTRLEPLTRVNPETKQQHVADIQDYKRKKQAPPIRVYQPQSTNNQNNQGYLVCPMCHGKLVIKTAKQGKYAGRKFYSCQNYPHCKYTHDI